jgi:DNA-binding LacI/PurR family transcriptional regulator
MTTSPGTGDRQRADPGVAETPPGDGRGGEGPGRSPAPAGPAPPPRRVTSWDVARRAGVSQNTVSLILKGSRRISAETAARVRAVMAEMAYQPNAVAAALRSRRTRALLFVAPRESVRHHLTSDLIAGVTDEAAAEGYSVVIQPVQGDGSQAADLYRSQLVSAAVVFPRDIDDAAATALTAAGCPTVAVLSPCRCLGEAALMADDVGGAEAAVRHLLQRGHRRIAVVVPPGPPWGPAASRLAGARRAAATAGVSLWEVPVHDWAVADGYQAGRALLQGADRPTAVFAVSDRLAFGVLQAADEARCRVPHDLAVVGFDNAEWSRYSRPPLTTVEFPVYAIGREAVRRLLHPAETPAWTRAPARLEVRGSS